MRIKKIEWENYRQYHHVSIDFPKTNDRDYHFLIAENGVGKTTFFNSVNWCLYNEEPGLTDVEKAFSILNLDEQKMMQPQEEREVKVTVTVEADYTIYQYIRTEIFRKTEEGKIISKGNTLKVLVTRRGETTVINEQEDVCKGLVNNFIPKDLSQYYFFDAESLKDYFSRNSADSVKRAVYLLSDIDTLENLKNHLENREAAYRSVLSKKIKEKELDKEIARVSQDIEEKTEELSQIKGNIDKDEQELNRIDDFLKDKENVNAIEEKLAQAKQKVANIDESWNSYMAREKSFIREYTIYLKTLPAVNVLYQKLQAMDQNQELPPKIKAKFLQEMLTSHKCLVCDRELDADSTKHIQELLHLIETKEQYISLNPMKDYLQDIKEKCRHYPEARDQLLAERKRLDELRESIYKEQNSLEEQYRNISDSEQIKQYTSEKLKFERDKENNLVQSGKLTTILSQLKQQKEKLDKEFAKALTKQRAQDEKSRMYDLAQQGEKATAAIIKHIQANVREQVSEEMERIFLGMMWKEQTYQHVCLQKDYSLSCTDENGREGAGSLSGAESQLLALSFILALQRVSGYDSPLIIDTPVARTSGSLRVKFCQELKDIAQKKQIILLFTENEFAGDVANVLQGEQSSSYMLNLHNENDIEVKRYGKE